MLHAPLGVLLYDADADRVQCHLCGGWYRAPATAHLRRHDMTADEYREIAGLNARHVLGVPSLSALRAEQLRGRIARDPRIQQGIRNGVGLARSGRLQAKARELEQARAPRVECQRTLVAGGRRIGTNRASTFRERHERRAVELGFVGLERYLHERYVHQRIRIEDLAGELEASVSAVRATWIALASRCAATARAVNGYIANRAAARPHVERPAAAK